MPSAAEMGCYPVYIHTAARAETHVDTVFLFHILAEKNRYLYASHGTREVDEVFARRRPGFGFIKKFLRRRHVSDFPVFGYF